MSVSLTRSHFFSHLKLKIKYRSKQDPVHGALNTRGSRSSASLGFIEQNPATTGLVFLFCRSAGSREADATYGAVEYSTTPAITH